MLTLNRCLKTLLDPDLNHLYGLRHHHHLNPRYLSNHYLSPRYLSHHYLVEPSKIPISWVFIKQKCRVILNPNLLKRSWIHMMLYFPTMPEEMTPTSCSQSTATLISLHQKDVAEERGFGCKTTRFTKPRTRKIGQTVILF